MFTIQCAGCEAETNLSLEQSIYEGPFRCWKCKGTFIIKIENGELKSCKPVSEEEFERLSK